MDTPATFASDVFGGEVLEQAPDMIDRRRRAHVFKKLADKEFPHGRGWAGE